MENSKTNKIVFILGSGFSKAAGYPIQSGIMPIVHKNLKSEKEIQLAEFLLKELRKPKHTPLEDIYTLFDKAISEGRYISKNGPNRIRLFRKILDRNIAEIFSKKIPIKARLILKMFADELVTLRTESGQDADPLSIITTNWDFLVEDSIMELHPNQNIAVDYCVYDKQLDPELEKIYYPSLQLKARGDFNIKLLKLHGSISWVKCPACDSLYIAFSWDKLNELFKRKFECRECRNNLSEKTKLDLFHISPTFTKDLTNVHYKMIWWNTAFEIAQATHLVFIGYSLPLADYDFRNLLTKNLATANKIKIKIVLYSDETDGSISNYEQEKKRYKEFFGDLISDDDFSPHGAFHYINKLSHRSGNKNIWEFHEEPWRWKK